jgi:hypothetical protein
VSRSARATALVALVALASCGFAPAPSPSPPASVAGLGRWQPVSLPAADPLVGYGTVVATPTGFVVAGGYVDRPAAWSSPDGVVWLENSIPGDTRNPSQSIVWGDRVLLVGVGEFGPGCGHPFAIDTWVGDGTGSWLHAPFQQIFCAGGLPSVATAGDLAVIVGAGTGDVPYAWTSADGLHWEDHPGAFADIGLPFTVLATTAGFVTIGVGEQGTWFERSADGVRWRDLVILPAPRDARPIGATVVGTRLVVMLGEPAGTVVRLSSEEASTWTVDRVDGLVATALNRIEAVPGGLVALGGDDTGPTMFVSPDGLAWRRVVLPETARGGYVTDVAVGNGRAVMVGGAIGANGETSSAAWVGPAELLAP